MKNEEDFQNHIDKSGKEGNDMDLRAYQLVFNALKKEPQFDLSEKFADKIILRIEEKREASRDSVWMLIGVGSFIITAIISMVLLNFKFNFGAFRFFAGYPGLLLFGTLFILGLHLLDKKFVRPSIRL